MGKYNDVKKEVENLIAQGEKFLEGDVDFPKENELNECFIGEYENWYTKALYIVCSLVPARKADFESCYKAERRKDIVYDNYVISDMLRGVDCFQDGIKVFHLVRNQINILKSCYEKFDSKIFDLEMLLQADVFDSEIESAKHLAKRGFLRAAGAICGVILEKHLAKVCRDKGITISKKDPSIAVYNEKLKEVAYDTIEWRKIQRLADIRNLCDHEKDREPTAEEVQELISGTERVIKTIF